MQSSERSFWNKRERIVSRRRGNIIVHWRHNVTRRHSQRSNDNLFYKQIKSAGRREQQTDLEYYHAYLPSLRNYDVEIMDQCIPSSLENVVLGAREALTLIWIERSIKTITQRCNDNLRTLARCYDAPLLCHNMVKTTQATRNEEIKGLDSFPMHHCPSSSSYATRFPTSFTNLGNFHWVKSNLTIIIIIIISAERRRLMDINLP